MKNVTILPVIANCAWTQSPAAHDLQYAGFTFTNGFSAEIWKGLARAEDGRDLYAVRVLNAEGYSADNTAFGPARGSLTEMAANFAIREIMDLDTHGRTRDYLDERPER